MSTIKPIDKELIVDTAKKCNKIITVEEHNIMGGLGSAVSEVICEEYPVLVKKVGVNDRFGQSGKPNDLLQEYGLTKETVIDLAKSILGK